MQYYSSAEIFSQAANSHTDGPFVKLTALQDSTLDIDSSVIKGVKESNGNYITITLKANASIEGVYIKSIMLKTGSVICYKA